MVVSVFGTVCADVAHVGLGITYSVATPVFAIVSTLILVTWYRMEGTLSVHSGASARREFLY